MAALMPHTCQYPALPTRILSCLQEQRQAGQMCDVIIKVGSRSFPAHRGVLCACSGYFKALFTDSEASSVELRLVTEKGVSVLLDYMYTARLHLTAGDAQEVMLAAVYLQVSDIMEDCTAYLGHTFQQSQLVGQRSTVSMETIPHGRQDNRENNVSEEGESQSRPRVSRDTSGDAVNHMDQGGSGLDRAHDGRCYPANHRTGSQANVGNRLREMHDGRSSSTNHTPALQSETGNRPEGVHDGRSSAANHTSGSQNTVVYRQGEVSEGTEVQVNKTGCLQSGQDNSKDVLTSSLITIKQEPEENDATLSSEVEDNPSLVEHHSHSEFPDCSFGASTESFSPTVTTVSSSHSVDRINTIANTLFQQHQEIYDKDSMNVHHQNRAVVPPGNQNMQATLPPFATGGYGPLNSLQGLFPMSSDPLASVDLWSVTSDTRSGSLDTSFYSRPQNKHVCVKCGASFKYASSLRAHKLYKHSNARPFICSTCGYSFKDKSMLKRHSRVHKKGPQTCVSLPSQVGIAAVDKSSCPADSIPVSSRECATPTSPTRAGDTNMEKSHSSAAQNENSLQVQGHNHGDIMPDQSGVDGTEAPTRWTTEGGSLLQAGLQGNQKEEDGNTFDRTTPPRVDPDTAGSETINQVNMFSTMLPKSTPMLLTSEGVASTTESSMTREGNDLGEDNPRSHQQTTLGHGQAVVTCPSTFRNQGDVGNTAVSYISSFISRPDVSTTQNEALFSMMAVGASPSQYHQVAMETPAEMSPKAFCCTECSAVFKYDSSLRAHKLYKHSNARPFVCQDCGYAFKAKGMLLRHRRSQHPKPDGQ
ncbi:uncharacterized protein LOC144864117 [Branchiostoma floridae x Branchiostoma japonicum]